VETTDNIQAECRIEEYTIIIFKFVELIPPSIPTKAEEMIAVYVRKFKLNEIRVKGATFCQESKTKQRCHSEHIITWGSQNWKGAIPVLTNRLAVIIRLRTQGSSFTLNE